MSDHFVFKKTHFNLGIFILCSALISGCSDSDDKQIKNTLSTPKPDSSTQVEQSTSTKAVSSAASLFIDLVDEHFSDLINESKKLNEILIAFTKKPSKEGLQETIKTLESTHDLFVSGYFLDDCCFIYTQNPSKDANSSSTIALKTRLDQQPLLPGYLDVVDGYPYSGLIYSDIPISREDMEKEFQLGDPNYVTLGFHALELILKGSNLKREFSDFAALSSTSDTSSAPAELRRTLYAILLASEIEKDISTLKSTWESNLKKQLQGQTPKQSNSFFLALNLKIEKALENIQSEHKNPENKNTQIDEHLTLESQALKQTLLEKLAALKALATDD